MGKAIYVNINIQLILVFFGIFQWQGNFQVNEIKLKIKEKSCLKYSYVKYIIFNTVLNKKCTVFK